MPKIKYPIGVTDKEKSPFFHIADEPWMLFPHMLRQYIVADLPFKYIHKEEDMQILDVGCGYCEQYILMGRREFMTQRKKNYIGLDLDQGKRDAILARYPKIDFRIADITKFEEIESELPTPNVVIMSDTLEHITKLEGEKLLKQLFQHMDGIMVVSVPTPQRSNYRKNKHHQHEWEWLEFEQTVLEIGYKIWDMFYIHVPVRSWKDPMIKNRLPHAISSPTMGLLEKEAEGSTIIAVLSNVRTENENNS